MDQQNNNPAPERHVPTEAEIARLEAEAAAALQRGDAIPCHAATPDDAAEADANIGRVGMYKMIPLG